MRAAIYLDLSYRPMRRLSFIDFMRRAFAPAERDFMPALRIEAFCLAERRTTPETRLLMRTFLPPRITIFLR